MLDQNPDPNLTPSNEPPAEESSNRTFIIAVGILGGLVLLTIIGVVLYAFVLRKPAAATADARATAEAYNVQIAQAMTATREASLWTATVPPTLVVLASPEATDTPVVALPTESPTDIYDPLTATMEALYTQAAIAQLTPTSTLISAGALPEGGFAEEYGIPGLLLMSAVLVVVIFLARRLRVAPQK